MFTDCRDEEDNDFHLSNGARDALQEIDRSNDKLKARVVYVLFDERDDSTNPLSSAVRDNLLSRCFYPVDIDFLHTLLLE